MFKSNRLFWSIASFLVALLALVVEVLGWKNGYLGPIKSYLYDIIGPPKTGTIIWFGFILSLVFFPKSFRRKVFFVAFALDFGFALFWYFCGPRLSYGNGALLVMFAILLGGKINLIKGPDRRVYYGISLGLLFILFSKIADSWLEVTAIYRKNVLDEFPALFDNVFWQPSWRMGEFLVWAGPVAQWIVKFIYIQLPLAALIIAIYQLNKKYAYSIIIPFIAVGVFGPIIYMLFPVVGPVYFFSSAGNGYNILDIWPNILPHITNPVAVSFDSVTPRNCMPSLHTAWAIIICLHAWNTSKSLRGLGILWLVSTMISTLGFGYHYGADILAGIIFALLIESLSRPLRHNGQWNRYRFCILAGSSLVALLLSYRFLPVFANEHLILMRLAILLILVINVSIFSKTFVFKPQLGKKTENYLI